MKRRRRVQKPTKQEVPRSFDFKAFGLILIGLLLVFLTEEANAINVQTFGHGAENAENGRLFESLQTLKQANKEQPSNKTALHQEKPVQLAQKSEAN